MNHLVMAKKYFDADRWDAGDDTIRCYALRFHLEELKDECLTHRRLYPAMVEKGSGFFYCRHHGEVGEKGEGCGRQCAAYAPRNGKNGRCRYHSNCYDADTKTPVLLKLDGTLVPAAPGTGLWARVQNTPAVSLQAINEKTKDSRPGDVLRELERWADEMEG